MYAKHKVRETHAVPLCYLRSGGDSNNKSSGAEAVGPFTGRASASVLSWQTQEK